MVLEDRDFARWLARELRLLSKRPEGALWTLWHVKTLEEESYLWTKQQTSLDTELCLVLVFDFSTPVVVKNKITVVSEALQFLFRSSMPDRPRYLGYKDLFPFWQFLEFYTKWKEWKHFMPLYRHYFRVCLSLSCCSVAHSLFLLQTSLTQLSPKSAVLT